MAKGNRGGQNSVKISKEMKSMFVGNDWNDIIHNRDNVKKIREEYGRDLNKAKQDWVTANMQNVQSQLHEIQEYQGMERASYKAQEILAEYITQGDMDGWFIRADSNYKPRIHKTLLLNPDAYNASMNIAWRDYNNFLEAKDEKPISFKKFLNTPLTVYRGDRGQKTMDSDTFTSFTVDKKIAKNFGSNITTRKIKPKDTLGQPNETGEFELLIPTEKALNLTKY